ncbi:MAG: aminotransferase class I/II-fold pyridoxal phosphate-dependent enzyme, partial [Bacteroidota bacterium]
MNISSKLPEVGTTIFTVMSKLALEHQAINLSQGFPNFAGSAHLLERVEYYLRNGYNQYAPMTGVPLLRQRIAAKIEQLYGLRIDADQEITITAGATQAIYTAISAFIHPGDEVILFEPAYDSYRPSVEVNGGVPIVYELTAPDYQVDWEELGRLLSARTRMII